jgi:MGT family glycosyltransferase
MAKILIATVPLTGHINPGLPIAKLLNLKGHDIIWYTGKDFREKIETTGARFIPFSIADEFNDHTISKKYQASDKIGALRQAIHYFKSVFYGQMISQWQDITNILSDFNADLIITDWMFMGAIPIAEKNNFKWVIYSNSPIFYLSEDAPAPGGGFRYSVTPFARYQNRFVNWLTTYVLFAGVKKFVNIKRAEIGLKPIKSFFLDHNVNICSLFLQFATTKFEYPRGNLPAHAHFVGPVPPPESSDLNFNWWPKLNEDHPVIFITQGTLDADNINKLVIPSIQALKDMDFLILVTTGGTGTRQLKSQFNYPNVFIEDYIPYNQLMPFVDVLISNGGYGGVLNALSFGVPVIIAGNSEEKRDVASRLEYSGAGLNLKTGTPKPRQIVKAIKKILTDNSYKLKALEIKADFEKYNAVEESVKLIEKLLEKS